MLLLLLSEYDEAVLTTLADPLLLLALTVAVALATALEVATTTADVAVVEPDGVHHTVCVCVHQGLSEEAVHHVFCWASAAAIGCGSGSGFAFAMGDANAMVERVSARRAERYIVGFGCVWEYWWISCVLFEAICVCLWYRWNLLSRKCSYIS